MPWNAVLRTLVAVAGTVGSGALAAPPPEAVAAAAKAEWLRSDEGLGVEAVRRSVQVPIGLPAIVPFRVATATPFHRVAAVTVPEGTPARVVDHGQIAAGATVGFAVVQGTGEGTGEIRIAGATVTLETVRPATPPGAAERPRVLTPLDGAAVWGTVSVGVTWWRPTSPGGEPPRLVVAGQSFAPVWTTTLGDGPVGLAGYQIDLSGVDGDVVELRPEWAADLDSAESNAARGGPVQVRIVRPDSAMVLSGECEATYDLPPLPDERRERPPQISRNEAASGGAFFNNAAAAPRFRFPVEVPEGSSAGQGTGWYQVMITAGGDEACGALPSVGITVDEAQYPVTRSAIALPRFHRVPVGLPVRLEPGRRILRVDFLNDFATSGADRNLWLDKIEVVRVADAARQGPAATTGSESAMMSMSGESAMADVAMNTAAKPDFAMAGDGEAMDAGSMMGGEPGVSGDRWPESAAMRARRGDPPVIAFARPLDGAVIAGDLEVRSVAWWPGIGDRGTPPPRTTLMLNGTSVAEQIAAAPRFLVPWSALQPGENTVSLVADGAAFTVRSAEATVFARKPASSLAEAGATPPRFHRFTVHDPRWDAPTRTFITDQQNPPERVCFGLASNADLDLRLPAELTGEYRLDIEARGQHFRGGPEIAVWLDTPGETQPAAIGSVLVPTNWDDHPVMQDGPDEKNRRPATVTLPAGPKRLRLSFTNDLYEPDKGDRNVYIQAVVLRPTLPPAERDEPLKARLTYPAAGQPVRAGAADALVFEVDGPLPARSAEIMLDGAATGQVIDVRRRMGPFVAPLTLRGIGPGRHEVAVQITDGRGRTFTTPAIAVEAVDAASDQLTPYERTLVVLDRFGFGPDEGELAAALVTGPERYLKARLSDGPEAGSVRAARELASARYPNSSNAGDVQRRAILEAIATDNAVRARFVLWAQNHFSTWIRKTEARRKADEHDRFSQLGVASFDQLLTASATSPAMLRYLDQEQSFARRLNENYAREIMELHTLGVHGGYTQEDVTTLARMLTGWTTAREGFVGGASAGEDGVGPDEYGLRESFRFDPVLGDNQPRVFLGRRFAAAKPEDRYPRVLTAIGMLASHPNTARFVCRKICEHYVGFPAPDDLVEDLASTFERTGGDMPEVLRTLANHPRFWATPRGQRLAHPPDFAFRLARCVGSLDADGIHQYLNLSGRGMFDRSTPDGYQENDTESMDSNSMLQRWKFARRLESSLLELIPAASRTGDKPMPDDDVQRIIDLVAIRLTGRLLGEHSNAAALDLFRSTASKEGKDAGGGRRDERWRATAAFIASTPEAQLK